MADMQLTGDLAPAPATTEISDDTPPAQKAWREHNALMQRTQAEIGRLTRCIDDDDDVDAVLRMVGERRAAQDQLEALQARSQRVKAKAENERLRALRERVNTQWASVSQAKSEALAAFEEQLDVLVALHEEINQYSERQTVIIQDSHELSPSQTAGRVYQIQNAAGYRAAFVARRLGLANQSLELSRYIPQAGDAWGEGLTKSLRII